jgi:hypothetical protein
LHLPTYSTTSTCDPSSEPPYESQQRATNHLLVNIKGKRSMEFREVEGCNISAKGTI